MLELGKRPFLLHPPVMVESLPQMGELLFRSAFGHLITPGELFTFDPVIFCLEIFDCDPLALGPRFFPTSQRPIIGVTGHPAGFTKVRLLFWRRIQSDHMRSLHALFLLQCRFFQDLPV
jgi:hypothetical protein